MSHYPFSHLAGANIPLAIVEWLIGNKPSEKVFKIKYGIKGIKDICPKIISKNE